MTNDVDPGGRQPLGGRAVRAAARGHGAATRGDAPAAHDLDFATLLRIISEWRWLILGAIALGLAAAIDRRPC